MMKKEILKVAAKMAEKSIKGDTRATCSWWSYQPKVPKNIKEFKK